MDKILLFSQNGNFIFFFSLLNDNRLYYFHLLRFSFFGLGDEISGIWGVLRENLGRDFGKVIGIILIN